MRCPKCGYVGVMNLSTIVKDLGNYGKYSWNRYICTGCRKVWVERLRLGPTDAQKFIGEDEDDGQRSKRRTAPKRQKKNPSGQGRS